MNNQSERDDIVFKLEQFPENRVYVTITAEGKVIIPDDITLDEAAKYFWDAVRKQALQAQPQAAAQGDGLPPGEVGQVYDARVHKFVDPPSQPCQICGGSGVLPKGGDKGSTRYTCTTCHGTGHISAPPQPSGESLLTDKEMLDIDNLSIERVKMYLKAQIAKTRQHSDKQVLDIVESVINEVHGIPERRKWIMERIRQHLANGGK